MRLRDQHPLRREGKYSKSWSARENATVSGTRLAVLGTRAAGYNMMTSIALARFLRGLRRAPREYTYVPTTPQGAVGASEAGCMEKQDVTVSGNIQPLVGTGRIYIGAIGAKPRLMREPGSRPAYVSMGGWEKRGRLCSRRIGIARYRKHQQQRHMVPVAGIYEDDQYWLVMHVPF